MRTANRLVWALLLAGCAGPGDKRFLSIGETYRSFGQVDNASRWAPTDCQPPPPAQTAPRLSASRDAQTHGRKLYYLFAKDRASYLHARELAQPIGQVVVKESWIPAEGSTPAHPAAGIRGPLFVMLKTGEADSDGGWIYATLTPDGSRVTASGKLVSCMECHRSARFDRLFGLSSCASPE